MWEQSYETAEFRRNSSWERVLRDALPARDTETPPCPPNPELPDIFFCSSPAHPLPRRRPRTPYIKVVNAEDEGRASGLCPRYAVKASA